MSYELAKTFNAYTDDKWIKSNITDLRFVNHPLWEGAATKGTLKLDSPTGHTWKIRLAYGTTDHTKPFNDDTDLLTDRNDVPIKRTESGTYGFGEYCYYSNAIILGVIEDDLEQRGDVQLESIIDDEVFKIRDDMFNSMYGALYGTGVTTQTNSQLKTLTSFRDMLRSGVASGTMDKYEGIERSGTFLATDRFPLVTGDTNQWWMPTVGAATGTTDLIWELKSWIHAAAQRNKGKKFSVIFCNEDMMKVLNDMQQSKMAILMPWTPTKMDLDWAAEFAIDRVPLVQDDNIPANTFWGLEFGTFKLVENMPYKLTPWAYMQHYTKMYATLQWGGQLICNNVGGNGVFTYTP
jgi:hypothetical protein